MLLVVLPEDLVLRATVQQTETLRLDCADNCKSAHSSVLVKNLCDWKLKFPEKNSFNALVVPAVTVKNEYKNLRNWNAWSIQNILADLCIPSISESR